MKFSSIVDFTSAHSWFIPHDGEGPIFRCLSFHVYNLCNKEWDSFQLVLFPYFYSYKHSTSHILSWIKYRKKVGTMITRDNIVATIIYSDYWKSYCANVEVCFEYDPDLFWKCCLSYLDAILTDEYVVHSTSLI